MTAAVVHTDEYRIVYEIQYAKLVGMIVIEDKETKNWYLETCIEVENNDKIFPRFKMQNRESAKALESKIKYAKNHYDESLYTVHLWHDRD